MTDKNISKDIQDNITKLNVGGTQYTTSKEILGNPK
jgi:hypothetical protein